ncbi:MAG: hypothetical protein PHE68_00800 [Candidatus Peribacteraceae bacterium]|nr:hypothetical protein [Candidatus Peribacteraceae bacterium]MDD5074335.1 hypothetical protein [Candidatus Peribacteraceae bacterium]
MKATRFLAFSLVPLCVFLASCGEEPPAPPPLPQGEQTVKGLLLPTEISLLRRGTHVLKKDGKEFCLVESQTVNLRSFENNEVEMKGTFEYNSDPQLLPVLVVREMKLTEQDTKDVSLPSLGFSCRTPTAWTKEEVSGSTRFIMTGNPEPIVSVQKKKGASLPTGAPFLIDGNHAVRTVDATTKAESVSLINGDDLITFAFTPGPEPSDELKAQWSSFLDSIHFSSVDGSSSSASDTGSSENDEGAPCGGAAGILCPSGQYCAITDVKENIGKCRSVK